MMKKVHTQKTVNYNNKKYVGHKRNNAINVKVSQTAKGQLISAGSFNLKTKTWSDCGRKGSLPTPVKKIFEDSFDI